MNQTNMEQWVCDAKPFSLIELLIMKEGSGLIHVNTGDIFISSIRLSNGGYPLLNQREMKTLTLKDISIN